MLPFVQQLVKVLPPLAAREFKFKIMANVGKRFARFTNIHTSAPTYAFFK